MKNFLQGHATHPDWRMALALAAAQIEAQRREPGNASTPTLGWIYLTAHFTNAAVALLAELRTRWPGVAWVGAVGAGVCASGVEYFDEPALSLMLGDPPRGQFRIYSGARPMGDFAAHVAQVHASAGTPDLADMIREMSDRVSTGYLFGGLAAGALHIADDALSGGLSGVAFSRDIGLVSRVTQGCQPIGPLRNVTQAERNVITRLDDEPALDCLLRDLGADPGDPRRALPRIRQTLVGLSDGTTATAKVSAGEFDTLARRGAFGSDTRVRHLVGLDPGLRGIAIGDAVEPGMQVAFCHRDTEAARRDLMRICAEIREALEPEELPLSEVLATQRLPGTEAAAAEPLPRRIVGAVYVSCAGRGGPHFGAPSAEMAIVRHALGDVPLVGFFAAGEIARHHLYGYTGVLTVLLA